MLFLKYTAFLYLYSTYNSLKNLIISLQMGECCCMLKVFLRLKIFSQILVTIRPID